MTLKEQFQDVQDAYHDRSDDCVIVADKFAIEFAEWLNINYFQIVGNKTWCKTLSMENEYTSKELLQIFKKEKGL